MKKLLFVAVGIMMLAVCGCKKSGEKSPEQKKIDSLQALVTTQDSVMKDRLDKINMINDGLHQISEAEGRITLGDSSVEGGLTKEAIQDNIDFIEGKMQENKNLIDQLKAELEANKANEGVGNALAASLRKTISDLEAQVDAQNKRIKELEKKLVEKDAIILTKDETINGQNEQINGLNGQVNDLTQNVTNLNTEKEQLNGQVSKLNQDNTNLTNEVTKAKAENEKKSETVAQQDKELNTAWYVFGKKSELKAEKIIDKGEVLKSGNFNKEYFTQVDIRNLHSLQLGSKSAKILTTHPANSYTLAKGSDGNYTLTISNPSSFWSVSRYLVVQVK